MRKYLLAGIILLLSVSFYGCKDSDNNATSFSKAFAFNSGSEGWAWGFADYPPGNEDFYELSGSHAKLPEPLDSSRGSIRISGNNHSDDLFMFIKKKLTGLKPDTSYTGRLTIYLASNAAEGSFGIGGSPANSVYLKAGITSEEPVTVSNGGYYRMSIDKGNQAVGGQDMQTIGDVSNGTSEFTYKIIQRNSSLISFRSSSDGSCWIIVGTDSGFEGTTTLFYNSVGIEIEESK